MVVYPVVLRKVFNVLILRPAGCLSLVLCALFTQQAAAAFEDVIQTKPKEFTYGKHPVLQADVVELEFQVDKTRSKGLELTRTNTLNQKRGDSVSQNFGFEYRIKPTPNLVMKQSLRVGVGKRYDIDENYFNDRTEDHWNQIQRSEIALSNESKSVQFNLYQQYRQVFHAEREVADTYFKYGGNMTARLTRNFSVTPEWSMEEQTDFRLRRTDRERYGARFAWNASSRHGLTVKPEAYVERQTDFRGQPRDRQGAGVALVKSFPKQRLSLQVKPLYIEEHVDIGDRGNQSVERLDASVAWTPVKELSVRTGGILERQNYYVQHRQNSNETIYSTVVHRPIDDFSLSIRGDYRLKSSEYEYSPYRNAEDAQMKVSISPEYQISEYLVASAQYLYEYRTPNANIEYPEEQVVTVSLRGQF